MPPPLDGPERAARRLIDAALDKAGWAVQHRDELNLAASEAWPRVSTG